MPSDISKATASRYVVVIDDDLLVRSVIAAGTGVHAVGFTSIEEITERAAGLRPIAVFLDIDLNGETSLPHLPALRAMFSGIPIIAITSARDVGLLAEALAKGADDFIRKPLHPVEVRARLEARLADYRDSAQANRRTYLDVDLNRRDDVVCGPLQCLQLSGREAKLLGVLMAARGTCVSRERLASVAWGALTVTRNALDKRIQAIRAALKEVGSSVTISTKYGVGYRLETEASRDSEP